MKTTSEKTQSWNEVIKECFIVFDRVQKFLYYFFITLFECVIQYTRHTFTDGVRFHFAEGLRLCAPRIGRHSEQPAGGRDIRRVRRRQQRPHRFRRVFLSRQELLNGRGRRLGRAQTFSFV